MSSTSIHSMSLSSSSSSSASASDSSLSPNQLDPLPLSLQDRITQVKQIILQAKQEFLQQYHPKLPNIHLDKIVCPISLESINDPR